MNAADLKPFMAVRTVNGDAVIVNCNSTSVRVSYYGPLPSVPRAKRRRAVRTRPAEETLPLSKIVAIID